MGDNYASGSNANIREETEFSTSNIEDKSHAGTELTNVSDEVTTTNADEVSMTAKMVSTYFKECYNEKICVYSNVLKLNFSSSLSSSN